MFETLVIIFIVSTYAAFMLLGGLFVFRVVYALRVDLDAKKRLAIIFLPGGMGLYKFANHNVWMIRIYQGVVLLMFILALIGGFYMAFLNIHWVSHTFFYGF